MKRTTFDYCIILTISLMSVSAHTARAYCESQDTTRMVSLDEVSINAELVRKTADGDQYLITEQMRARGSNSLELLAQIPGIQFNRTSNQILINNKSNILILVNGRPRTKEFIVSLSPNNIKAVKVIHNPKGRYSSEGYSAVIDIVARKEEGWDINLSNMILANPTKNNGSNHILMEQPACNIAYTQNKLSVYGYGVYGISRWNTPVANELKGIQLEPDAISSVSGIEKYVYNGRAASVGLNYYIKPTHVLSFDYDFLHENDKVVNDMQGDNHDYFQQDKTCRVSNNYTLYYKGKFGDKLDVYSDISISNYKNDYQNGCEDQSDKFTSDNVEKRKAVDITADLKWSFTDKVELKFGALAHDRMFDTEGISFKYHRTQSRVWCYFGVNPTEQWNIEAGVAFDNDVIRYSEKSRVENRILPSLQFSYAPTADVMLKGSYASDVVYPTLKQISTIRSAVYPNVYHIGNPDLEKALKHKFSFEVNVFDMLSFEPSFEICSHAICPLVFSNDDMYEMTYRNADIKELLLPLNIDFPLSKRLFCSVGSGYYKSFGRYLSTQRDYDGFYCNADVMYQGKFLNLNASYYRSIQKESLIQGYNETGLDSWMIAANRQWNKNLSTMICWFLPLDFGVRSNVAKSVHSEGFYLHERKSMKPYRNTFNIQIVYRFQSGESKFSRKRNSIESESRISGGMTNF